MTEPSRPFSTEESWKSDLARLNDVLALKPVAEKAAETHWHVGCIWLDRKNAAKAVASLRHAVGLSPTRAEYRFWLGESLWLARQYRSALETWLPVLSETGDVLWLNKISRHLIKAGTKDPQVRVGLLRLLPNFDRVESPSSSLRILWAQIAAACGQPHQALARLAPLMAEPVEQGEALKTIVQEIISTLETAGDHSGFELLREWNRQSGGRGTAAHILIHCAERVGISDDDLIALAERIMNDPASPHVFVRAALNLVFFRRGSSSLLLERMLGLFALIQPPDEILAGDIADMLWVLGLKDQLVSFYGENHALFIPVKNRLSVAYARRHANPAGESAESLGAADRILQTFEKVKAESERIWSMFADPKFSVAVVGNSNCEAGRSQGAEIDAHTHVIRFNDFSVNPPYDKDYGVKTTFIVRGLGKTPIIGSNWPQYSGRKPGLILTGPRVSERTRHWDHIAGVIAKGFSVAVLPSHLVNQLSDMYPRPSSSGLKLAWVLSQVRPARTGIDYYGFSLVDQIGPSAQSAHYFEVARPSYRHDWDREAEFFNRFTGHVPRASQAAPGPKKLSIKFVGDHSACHAGSAAVVDYIESEILIHGHRAPDEDYDVLIVNGEGSMHHDYKGCLDKIAEMEAAVLRGKPAYLLNSVWQDNSSSTASVLSSLCGIYVREEASQRELRERHGIDSVVRLDLSYGAPIDEGASFTNYAGAVVSGDFYSHEFKNYVRLNGGAIAAYPFVDMKGVSWSSLVKTLRTAKLLVTGRHHGVYAACRARIPFVALAGNTHKIEGLVEMSKLPIPVCKNPFQIENAIKWALRNEAVYKEFFTWMDSLPVFHLTDLGPPFVPARDAAPHRLDSGVKD